MGGVLQHKERPPQTCSRKVILTRYTSAQEAFFAQWPDVRTAVSPPSSARSSTRSLSRPQTCNYLMAEHRSLAEFRGAGGAAHLSPPVNGSSVTAFVGDSSTQQLNGTACVVGSETNIGANAFANLVSEATGPANPVSDAPEAYDKNLGLHSGWKPLVLTAAMPTPRSWSPYRGEQSTAQGDELFEVGLPSPYELGQVVSQRQRPRGIPRRVLKFPLEDESRRDESGAWGESTSAMFSSTITAAGTSCSSFYSTRTSSSLPRKPMSARRAGEWSKDWVVLNSIPAQCRVLGQLNSMPNSARPSDQVGSGVPAQEGGAAPGVSDSPVNSAGSVANLHNDSGEAIACIDGDGGLLLKGGAPARGKPTLRFGVHLPPVLKNVQVLHPPKLRPPAAVLSGRRLGAPRPPAAPDAFPAVEAVEPE